MISPKKISQNKYNKHVTQTTPQKQRHQLNQQNLNKIETENDNIAFERMR